jgi:hypothetical protein
VLKHVTEGKREERIKLKARRRRRRIRKQLLDDIKETRGDWKLKEESLDRALLRNCCGRGCGPFVGRTT